MKRQDLQDEQDSIGQNQSYVFILLILSNLPDFAILLNNFMTHELFAEIIATYQRHGWELRRVLLRPETRAELNEKAQQLFKDAPLIEADLDALWFARPSHAGREAWELRHVAAQPYALFEAFETDEDEELREAARREMENLMRDQTRKQEMSSGNS